MKMVRKVCDIILAHEKDRDEAFVRWLEGKSPLFICTIGTTETAKIQGISAAGRYPELTDYTPPADVELASSTAWDRNPHSSNGGESGGQT